MVGGGVTVTVSDIHRAVRCLGEGDPSGLGVGWRRVGGRVVRRVVRWRGGEKLGRLDQPNGLEFDAAFFPVLRFVDSGLVESVVVACGGGLWVLGPRHDGGRTVGDIPHHGEIGLVKEAKVFAALALIVVGDGWRQRHFVTGYPDRPAEMLGAGCTRWAGCW